MPDDIVSDFFGGPGYQPPGKVAEPKPPPEADKDEVPEWWITSVVKRAMSETSVGLAAQATGIIDPPDPRDLGTFGDIAAGVGSFVLDPATYFGAGLGGLATKAVTRGVGKKLATKGLQKGAKGFAARSAIGAIKPAITLGTVTAARDPVIQFLETGTVDPFETALHTAQSTAVGAFLGPAGQMGKLAIPSEIAAFAVADPLLHGELPSGDSLVHATGAVLGMRAVGAVTSKGQALLRDYKSRKAAGQKDPTPNAKAFEEAGEPDLTRKQRAERIEELLEAETKSAEEQTEPQRVGPTTQAEPGAPTPPAPGASLPSVQGAQAQSPAKPSGVGRPELANPALTPEARAEVDRIDQARKEAGVPGVRKRETVEAEAEAALERDFAGERDSVMRTGIGRGPVDTGTAIAGKIITREWPDALKMGGKAREDMVRLVDAYRTRRTEAGRELGQGYDRIESPAQRLQRIVGESVFTVPRKQQKQIDRARARNDSEAADKILSRWSEKVEELQDVLDRMGIKLENLDFETLDPVVAWQAIHATQAWKADRWDMMYEYWRNSILSAPTTQAANITGNMLNASWNLTAERLAEATINLVARDPKSAQFGELRHLYRGMLPGITKGARNALRTWRSEAPTFQDPLRGPTSKLENLSVAIPGKAGRGIRIPQRLLLAVDDFFKTMVGQMEVNARAYRIAKAEGKKGQARAERVAELVADPQSVAWREARDSAQRLAFQEPGGPITKTVLKARKDIPGFRYLVPFVTTPAAIFRQGLRKSPFGALVLPKEIWKGITKGDWSGVTVQMAEQALVWSAMLVLLDNDPNDPWITGTQKYGDASPHPEQSIRIGDQWVSYRRVEPFATLMATTVDSIQAWQRGGSAAAAQEPLLSVARQLGNKTFLMGIGDLLNVIEAAARGEDLHSAARWSSKFATSWIPNLVRGARRAESDTVPERGVWGKGPEWYSRMARRMGQGTGLGVADTPKVDLWGRDIPRDGSPFAQTDVLWRMFVPMGIAPDRSFSWERMMLRWNNENPEEDYHPRAPQKFWTLKGERFDLTDQQYYDYIKLAGELTSRTLMRIKFDEFNPTERQIEVIGKVIRNARLQAKKLLMRQWFQEGSLVRAA